jgi:hypothetical protein
MTAWDVFINSECMDLLDIFGLLLLAASGWLWYDSLKAREMAVSSARAACSSENLLLLDDTVAIQRISLGRDNEGVLRIRRIYAFEYSGAPLWGGQMQEK